ncbi:sirohydrochlorin chelatase [Hydrogenophaga pseudoflava]|uniref:sirohydrochlorin chelatase n=1 Tax=Hydrogenophaga pseudoflava TaxID=47421 RepID=UPI0027E50E17|nr:CbiX/SirB N-terminal domain-containing protein [Hydrogenophaga pseudoflava]MDQ7744436.1 CbiX/SirB N-terminal domain-containing protein [Hydrogenophaga pseudoflava]
MLGVIVFAHGSRDPLWRAPVESVARQIRDTAPSVRVVCAYLELSEPDLPTAAAQLVSQGASRIRVLPLFFGMGKHAREDLPVLLEQLARTHPGVHFERLATAGEDPRLTALLAQIALEPVR